MTITDAEILALQPKTKPYKFSIGQGAYILVLPNGHKYWRLKYHLNAKEGGYAVGVYPKVSIEAAQAALAAAKALVAQGINPTREKRRAKLTAAMSDVLIRLQLAKNGALTIETDRYALPLTLEQTQALAAFLFANNKEGKEST